MWYALKFGFLLSEEIIFDSINVNTSIRNRNFHCFRQRKWILYKERGGTLKSCQWLQAVLSLLFNLSERACSQATSQTVETMVRELSVENIFKSYSGDDV